MDNQHRKISGYRELSQEEIDLMNEIKEKGKKLGEVIAKVRMTRHTIEANDHEMEELDMERLKWAEEAEITLKTGIMQLVRAVALPAGF